VAKRVGEQVHDDLLEVHGVDPRRDRWGDDRDVDVVLAGREGGAEPGRHPRGQRPHIDRRRLDGVRQCLGAGEHQEVRCQLAEPFDLVERAAQRGLDFVSIAPACEGSTTGTSLDRLGVSALGLHRVPAGGRKPARRGGRG